MSSKRSVALFYSVIILFVFIIGLLVPASRERSIRFWNDKEEHHPYVILKFDDLTDRGAPWQGFKAVTDLCKEKGVKCTVGIFGQSLERGDSAYFSYLKKIAKDPDIEIWMHGYNGAADELVGNLSYQKYAFKKTRWNLLYYLDYLPRTFSPHWKSGDTCTVQAFLSDSLYLTWSLYPPKGSFKGLLENQCQLETGDNHYPDSLKMLISHYDSCAAKMDYFICQGHPWNWDEQARRTFGRYLDTLKSRGAQFITVYEYYRIRNNIQDSTPPSVPKVSSLVRKNSRSIEFSWDPSNDPETKVDAYKIYRNGKFIDITTKTRFQDSLKTEEINNPTYQVSAVNRANLASEKSLSVSFVKK